MRRAAFSAGLLIGTVGLIARQQGPLDLGARTPAFGTTVVSPSGLRGDIYFLKKNTVALPRFAASRLKPVGTIWTNTLFVPPRHWRDGFPGITKRFEWFAIDYSGRFWVDGPGRYRFALLSDDGSELYLDDRLVIDNDCVHPPDVRTAEVELSGGIHRIRVPYFQGPRDCVALILAIAAENGEWRLFDTERLRPPSNPRTWRYEESAAQLGAVKTGDDSMSVGEFLDELQQDDPATAKALARTDHSGGCTAAPVHGCGK